MRAESSQFARSTPGDGKEKKKRKKQARERYCTVFINKAINSGGLLLISIIISRVRTRTDKMYDGYTFHRLKLHDRTLFARKHSDDGDLDLRFGKSRAPNPSAADEFAGSYPPVLFSALTRDIEERKTRSPRVFNAASRLMRAEEQPAIEYTLSWSEWKTLLFRDHERARARERERGRKRKKREEASAPRSFHTTESKR